ncbi:hypothetical protein L1987_38519 [Smallanthus sonchifolius]|uniref:Uncharacterized protein n=1 Tax=Smallanthus sonchifolius TaxID=185202 RepID=A0ACB9HJG5_9ASTR|nr:hypothetical protein L1987_38519 [Smallanthus sonchifolius]
MGANAKALTNKIFTHLKLNSLSKAVSSLFESPVPVDISLYASLFNLCAARRTIIETRKVESHLLTFNPTPPVFLLNRAIEAYGKCTCLDDACELFDEMPQRDGGSWNALISAYALNGFADEALRVFLDMKRDGFSWNEVSFASVLRCCGSLLEIHFAMGIHGVIVKYGFSGNVIIASSIVDVYGKGGFLSDSRRIFDDISNPNEVSWNVIIRRHYDMGEEKEAVVLFFEMVKRNDVRPLSFTVSNALCACSRISAFNEGMQIHSFAVKMNLVDTLVVSGSLIDMYSKHGDLQSARNVFNQPNAKDLINWTSIITAYATNGRTKEARKLFNEMPERNIVSYNVGYTHNYKWEDALEIIPLISKTNIYVDHITIGAWFYQMGHLRYDVSWNSILTSHAHHKRSEEVMLVIRKMLEETSPNKHNLATILVACANIFALDPKYCVIPRLEHYESMIELYARYGYIGELENFVNKMPFDPTASMLIRVFDACHEYRHERFGKWAADRLNELNPSIPFKFELMDHRRMA